MKQRQTVALVVLGAIFLVLAIFLLITVLQGDETANPPKSFGTVVQLVDARRA
jgi:hypothetical protein